MSSKRAKILLTVTLISLFISYLFLEIISLLHMKEFWDISNTPMFSYILSIGTGLAVLSSLLMLLNKTHSFFPILLTFVAVVVEVLANIFYSFLHIDMNSESFQKWVDLMNPITESFFYENEILALARVTSIFQGSFIPLTAFLVFICIVLIIHNFDDITNKLIKKSTESTDTESNKEDALDSLDPIKNKEEDEQKDDIGIEKPKKAEKITSKKIKLPLLPESYKEGNKKTKKEQINYQENFDDFFDIEEEPPTIEKNATNPEKRKWKLK